MSRQPDSQGATQGLLKSQLRPSPAGARAVLLGGTGLLGRSLLRHAPPGLEVVAPDRRRFSLEDPESLLACLDSLDRARPLLGILMVAAWTDVDGCEDDPERAFRLNGGAPTRVAAIAADRRIPLVYLSTDYVFDGQSDRPYAEADPVGPRGVYAESKWQGECGVRDAGGDHRIVRTSGLYGPGGPDFVHAVGKRLEQDGADVVTDQTLSPTYVEDLAPALWAVLRSPHRGTFHLASSGAVSWYDFARRLAFLQGVEENRVRPTSTEAFGRPAPRPAFSALDCGKAMRMCGIRMPDWSDALTRCVKAYGSEWKAQGDPE